MVLLRRVAGAYAACQRQTEQGRQARSTERVGVQRHALPGCGSLDITNLIPVLTILPTQKSYFFILHATHRGARGDAEGKSVVPAAGAIACWVHVWSGHYTGAVQEHNVSAPAPYMGALGAWLARGSP